MTAVVELAVRRTAELHAYQAGQPARNLAGKLSSNEAPLGPAPAVTAALAAGVREFGRYPDVEPLRRQIAAEQGLDPSQIVVTSGSDEFCFMLAQLFLMPGAKVLLSDPCYQIDELVSTIHGVQPVAIPLLPDGSHDLDAFGRASADATLIWLPSPHNPTGVACDPTALKRWLADVPESCVVVLDEAYRAFLEPDRQVDVTELLKSYPNLIVQRTLSKEYGLAGLRAGYGMAAPAVIDALHRIKSPFNVNAAAIVAAGAAIAAPDWRAYGVDLVKRERHLLMLTLTRLGWPHFRSEANFVTFRAPDPERLRIALAQVEIVVREGADLGLPGWVRVSVGAPPVMAQLRRILEEL